MILKNIDLNTKYGAALTAVSNDRRFNDNEKEILRPAVLICAGGAYDYRSLREGEPAALRFASHGLAAFVMNYTCQRPFPDALIEVMKAMAYIKAHAEEYGIIKDRVYICGFSAGGHLAASLGVYHDNGEILSAAKVSASDARPCGQILCYPVITAGKYTHERTAENITGGDESLADTVSLEKHVTENTAPAFLWTTRDDGSVPVQNTLMFASALAEAGVAFTCHIFPHGSHGLALADFATARGKYHCVDECKQWFPLAMDWIMANEKDNISPFL